MKWIKALFEALADFFKSYEVKIKSPIPKPPVLFKFKKGMVGVDISHHNKNVDLKVLSKNVDFIYMKATEGATFVSSKYESRAKELKGLDIPWGAYHYYRVSTDPVAQANNFLNCIDVNSGLPPVLDIEAINNKFKPQHREDLLTFLSLVESVTKIKPIIYTGYYFAKYVFIPTEEFAKYDLWLPWYRKDFSGVKTPKPWDKITIWQYTETGNIEGVAGNVDVNKVV